VRAGLAVTFEWRKDRIELVEMIEVILPLDNVNTESRYLEVVNTLTGLSEIFVIVSAVEEDGVFLIYMDVLPGYRQQPNHVLPTVLKLLQNIGVSKSSYLLTYPESLQDISVFGDEV
jgi:hypothetical protein